MNTKNESQGSSPLEGSMTVPKEGMVTYSSYLKVNDLLKLQEPLSNPAEHDEMLFIVIHQVYELWFKQILHEVDLAERSLIEDNSFGALKALKRLTTIQRILTEQVSILETMTPNDFNTFRDRLNPASGFQSWQFRLLEFRMGLKEVAFLKFFQTNPETLASLTSVLHKPTFYDQVLRFLARKGYPIAKGTLERDVSALYEVRPDVESVFESIYRNHAKHNDAYFLLEALVDLDQQFSLWRYRHVAMVERMIGNRIGTGGSSGVKYLSSTMSKRFFPELWSIRGRLGGAGYGDQ
jgi:tryptophan 2,3-dioxygenase